MSLAPPAHQRRGRQRAVNHQRGHLDTAIHQRPGALPQRLAFGDRAHGEIWVAQGTYRPVAPGTTTTFALAERVALDGIENESDLERLRQLGYVK